MASSGDVTEANVSEVFLQKALRGKLQEIIYLIVEAPVDINYRNENGCSALHAAAAAGQLEVVQWLMKQDGIDHSVVDDQNQTPLHYAAFHGHLEVVQLLIEEGVPLDIPDSVGRLVHTAAAINGHLDVVTYVLEECGDVIDINAIDEYGGTCLHWAALKGRKEVVQYLCKKGIDSHLTSYDNRTAFQLAKDKHKHKCVKFLKAWMEQSQQFIQAAEQGDENELQRIIDAIGGNFPLRYLKDKDGRNALHHAAYQGKLSTLKFLAEKFDVLTDVDKCGRNALHWAALGGHKECAKLLVLRARGTSLIHTLTLTNKSASRCAFEAGHSTLASKLQGWEEGDDEFLSQEGSRVSASPKHRRSDPSLSPRKEKKDFVTKPRDMNTVQSWLAQVELDEYTNSFARDGFDTLRGVATIDEHDLIDMRVKKGHRRVVLSRIDDLRHQLAILDDSYKQDGSEPEQAPTLGMLPQLNKSSSIQSSASATSAPIPIPSPSVPYPQVSVGMGAMGMGMVPMGIPHPPPMAPSPVSHPSASPSASPSPSPSPSLPMATPMHSSFPSQVTGLPPSSAPAAIPYAAPLSSQQEENSHEQPSSHSSSPPPSSQ